MEDVRKALLSGKIGALQGHGEISSARRECGRHCFVRGKLSCAEEQSRMERATGDDQGS
jgi:hypothetical protein